MLIPAELKEKINDGILCPICNVGHLIVVPTTVYYEIKCDNCNKNVIITCDSNTFEIIDIKEVGGD